MSIEPSVSRWSRINERTGSNQNLPPLNQLPLIAMVVFSFLTPSGASNDAIAAHKATHYGAIVFFRRGTKFY